VPVLSPAPTTTGKALFEGTTSFRTKNDDADPKPSGTFLHNPLETSATELNEWIGYFQWLNTIIKSGQTAFPVRNTTGGSLAAGPIRITGWDESNASFLIAHADADVGPAHGFLLASVSNNSNATAYCGGQQLSSALDTSGSAVGNAVYLSTTAGGLTLTAPTGNVWQQKVGRVRTVANPGNIQILIEPPLLALVNLRDVTYGSGPASGDTIQWNGSAFVFTPNATTDEKVKSHASDANAAGYLSDKIDNSTLEVDTATTHKMRVKDAGVTYAKIQNVSATDKLLGRSTAGAGVVEEIACTSTGRSIIAAASVAAARAVLGLDTGDSPTFTNLTLSGTLNRYKRLISNKTGNYTILDTDSGTMFTNNGAAGTVTLTLPTAAAGLTYVFVVKETQTLDIVRAGSDVIYDNNGTTTSTHVSSNAAGRVIRLTAIAAGIWVTESIVGSWTYA